MCNIRSYICSVNDEVFMVTELYGVYFFFPTNRSDSTSLELLLPLFEDGKIVCHSLTHHDVCLKHVLVYLFFVEPIFTSL